MDLTITTNSSVKGFNWILKDIDQSNVLQLLNKLDVSEIIARILVGKKIHFNEVKNFLNPTIREYLPDPFHFLDMDKAVQIAVDAIINRKKIVIFGDYDVDGATSSALLKRFFRSVNIDAEIYIPDRIDEGYGPSIKAFSYLKDTGAELIITVDCGTAAFEAINYAAQNQIKTIIIDHHLSGTVLPNADAIVNPNRFDEPSQYKYLAAVGVAFLFCVAVNSNLRKMNFFESKQEVSLINFLDIVAIGTICDMVPLEPLNRAFVVQGLKILNKQLNQGINAFCKLLNIEGLITTYHLGYVFGPRINAGGRVGEALLGSKLLSTESLDEALSIAKKLELYNQERKSIENTVFDQALEQTLALNKNDSLIMVAGENWHPGVIGIVAGRLKEIYNKPVAVLSIEDNIAKASCRSINFVDFGSAIVRAKEHNIIVNGGGHKMAAGFTVLKDKIPALKEFLLQEFYKDLEQSRNREDRYYDAHLSTGAMNIDLAKQVEQLGPFGPSNPEPRFILSNIFIAKASIFANNHISCFVGCRERGNLTNLIKANAFRATESDLAEVLINSSNKILSLVGYIRINRWRGRENVEFNIEDVIINNLKN